MPRPLIVSGQQPQALGTQSVGQPRPLTGGRPLSLGASPSETTPKTGQSLLQGASEVVPNLAIGAAKGFGSTLASASTLGEKGLQFLTGQKPSPTGAEELGLKEMMKPKGLTQSIGFGAEQAAEFLLPVGGELKAEKIGAQLAEKIPEGGKLLGVAKKTAQILPEMVRSGAEFGGKTALQTGDLEKAKNAGVLGFVTPPVANTISKSFPWLAQQIEKSNLRMTPTQAKDLGGKLDGILTWMTDKKLIGTPTGRLEKVNSIYEDTEQQLQNFLTKDAKNVTTPKEKVLSELDALKSKYQNDRDVIDIENQIDSIKKTIERQPKDIPVANLNQLKRTTFKNAFNKAGTKVRDDVEYAAGDVLKNNLQDSTKGLKINGKPIEEFNSEYSKIIGARTLLKTAENRNQVGVVERMLLGIGMMTLGVEHGLGALSSVGLAGGAEEAAARYLGTPIKSTLGAGLSAVGGVTTPAIAKGVIKGITPQLGR